VSMCCCEFILQASSTSSYCHHEYIVDTSFTHHPNDQCEFLLNSETSSQSTTQIQFIAIKLGKSKAVSILYRVDGVSRRCHENGQQSPPPHELESFVHCPATTIGLAGRPSSTKGARGSHRPHQGRCPQTSMNSVLQ
jgi:hypothetical protein